MFSILKVLFFGWVYILEWLYTPPLDPHICGKINYNPNIFQHYQFQISILCLKV